MLIRIDARRLKDPAALHATLSDAFGFFEGYGKNLDALVDCLTSLDNSKTALSRAQVFPGQIVLLVIEHTQGLNPAAAAAGEILDGRGRLRELAPVGEQTTAYSGARV